MDVVDVLRSVPAFAGSPASRLAELTDEVRVVEIAPGTRHHLDSPVVVVNGGFRVLDPDGWVVDVVTAREYWTPVPETSVEATESSTLLGLPHRAVELAWEFSLPTTDAGEGAGPSTSMAGIMRPPLVVSPKDTAVEVAGAMTEHNTSAAIVAFPDGPGIVTDTDLRVRIVAAGLDPHIEVGDVATPHALTLGPETTVAEALETMIARGIHHLPVIDNGSTVGLVRDSDVARASSRDPFALRAQISAARGPDDLALLRARVPDVAGEMLAGGTDIMVVLRVLAAWADLAMERSMDWAGRTEAPESFCWVTLGSQARREQGLKTDQDHLLILADGADDEWFAEFAAQVVESMAAIGIARCKGGVMASESDWRRTSSAWRRHLSGFLVEASVENALQSSIVFDSRPIAGVETLIEPFNDIRKRLPVAGPFLAAVARASDDFRPPLGLTGRIAVDRRGAHAGSVDIKKGAIAPLTSLARLYSLLAGSPAIGTPDRLRAAADAGIISTDLADSLLHVFRLAHRLRLTQQVADHDAGRSVGNWVSVVDLSTWERSVLREGFRAIRRAQDSLELLFPGVLG